MDTDYLAAVERGDMEMAQRMVDEAGGWVGMVGADPRVSEDPESLWKEYETKNYGGKYSSDYMDIFETKNGGFALSMSKTYPYVEWSRSTAAGRGRTAYLELLYAAKTVGKKGVETQSFAESKAIGAWKSLERRGFISLKESSTEDRGEDGVYTVFEATILPKGEAFIRGETDPVTYDESGNVIPLSQRFDSTSDDTRYSQFGADLVEKYSLPATEEETKAFNRAASNKRAPELAVAAVRMKNNEITAGDYADLVDVLDPFVTKKRPDPIPTDDKIRKYIHSNKSKQVGLFDEKGQPRFIEGALYEFRIDIHTYNRVYSGRRYRTCYYGALTGQGRFCFGGRCCSLYRYREGAQP
jgi:hypothetical protein